MCSRATSWSATNASTLSSRYGRLAFRLRRWASCSGVETDRRGCVFVDSHLNPPGHPEIFICGDLAHVEENGRQIPGVAQPAMQMGRYAAKRIGRLIAVSLGSDGSGKDEPFHYFDKGDMATIGRKAAVANIQWPFKGHWSGFPAWMTWLVVHIFFLIGFRNRLSVFRQWAWTYLTFSDGARLITGSQELPGWNETERPQRQSRNKAAGHCFAEDVTHAVPRLRDANQVLRKRIA